MSDTRSLPPSADSSFNPLALSVRAHVAVWTVMAALSLALMAAFYAYRADDVWAGWQESNELRNHPYAERVYIESVFRTRVNTWSNLTYVLIGLYAVAYAWEDRRRKAVPSRGYLAQTPAMSLFFGASCIYLGLASGIFHASLTRWGQQLDVAAMYASVVGLITINAGRWFPRLSGNASAAGAPSWPLWIGIAILADALLYRFKWSMASSVVLPGLIAVMVLFSVADWFYARRKMSVSWAIAAFASIVASFVCRDLDVAGHFSGPDALLQGHSFWHLFTTLGLAGMYFYYRSEKTSD